MTQELKQSAQQALGALKFIRRQLKAWDEGDNTIAALERALTAAQPAQAGERKAFIHWMTATYPEVYKEYDAASYWTNGHVSALAWQARASLPTPPAAQAGEADTGPRVLREVFALCEDTMTKMESVRTEFSRGRAFEAKGISRAIGTWFQDEFCGRSHMGEPVTQPAAQATPDVPETDFGNKATPEPYIDSTPHLSVGDSRFEGWFSDYDPKGKGTKQQMRDAYAAGMGDPLVTAATPEPAQLDVVRQAIEDRDAMESRYHALAHNLTYQGNSVAWWYSKATAYRNAIDEVWSALRAAGVCADGTKTCADGVRELATTPEPVGEPALWVPTKQLDQRETTTRGYLWFSNPQNDSWTPLYPHPAPGVPEGFALVRDDLDRCRQWFDCIQDVHGGYLDRHDYELAKKLYTALGMRVPNSIGDLLAAAQAKGDQS